MNPLTDTILDCTEDTASPQPPSPAGSWWTCDGSTLADGTWNVRTTYAYDAQGNRITETAPNGRVTSSAYDEDGRLTQKVENDVASPTGPAQDVTTRYYYDAAGRLTAVEAPGADASTTLVTRSVYDANGRLVRTIAACIPAAGQGPGDCGGADGQAPGTMTFEANIVTDYAYDAKGNLAKVVAPDPSATAAGSGTVTTRYAYDTANRLCRVLESATVTDAAWADLTDPCVTAVSGTTTTNLSSRSTYDAAGNLASSIDAAGHTTGYTYDAAGRLLTTTDADARVLVYAYDALGRRIRQENRSDALHTASVTWTYDAAGRMLTRTADGVTTSYTYDDDGNKLTASDGTLDITATYDRLNRVLSVDDEDAGSAADTTYAYSLTSPSWTDPTGTYHVTLDAFDRPVALDEPVSTTASFTWAYRADGQPSSVGAPNGNTTAFGYDAAGRPATRITTGSGGIARAAYAWTRNAAGGVLSEDSQIASDPTNGTRAFAYDAAGRLAAFTDGATTTTWGWGTTLNRTSVQTGSDPAVTTTYDPANRPKDQAGVTDAFTSDADGRLTARPDAAGSPDQRLEWDSLGRLVRVRPPTGNSTIAAYAYDPLDRLRTVDHGGSNRIRFRYGGLTTTAVATIDDQGGAVIRSIGTGWGGEQLEDWTGSGSSLRVFGLNAHHDLTWTAGATGAVTGTVRYDPAGNTTPATITGSVPEFRFQGSWADDVTKLSWVVTRWYAPAQGRFISEDSLLGEPRDPDSRHLYAYGEGDPVGRWDPRGLDDWWAADNWRFLKVDRIEQPEWWGVLYGAAWGLLFGAGGALVAWVGSAGVVLSLGIGIGVSFLDVPRQLLHLADWPTNKDRAEIWYYVRPLHASRVKAVGNTYHLKKVLLYWENIRDRMYYMGSATYTFRVVQRRDRVAHFNRCRLVPIGGGRTISWPGRRCLYTW